MTTPSPSWQDRNQAALAAALRPVYAALARGTGSEAEAAQAEPASAEPAAADAVNGEAGAPPTTVDALCSMLGLSAFECSVLLLCAGIELESRFGRLCATVHGDAKKPFATFGLALAVLPDPHWSALTRQRPLRYWRLLEVLPGETLVNSPLRIDERILHFLTGIDCVDERLEPIVQSLEPDGALPGFLAKCAEGIAAVIGDPAQTGGQVARVQLVGRSASDRRLVAGTAFRNAGLTAHVLSARDIPSSAVERDALARLWNREARLRLSGLYVEIDPGDAAETLRHVPAFLERVAAPLIVGAAEATSLPGLAAMKIDLPAASAQQRREIWVESLGGAARHMNGELDAIVDQFRLDSHAIESASAAIRRLPQAEEAQLGRAAWRICRDRARGSMEQLARRIEPRSTWDDVVLPAAQHEILRQIAMHLRQRTTVHERWGFAGKYSRGLGITALFTGTSGTGKTMSAEVLAHSLDLDLYQIDLATVVSKYIGETEKNLKRIFDTAEDSGAILLFDEADALFGKRTEIKDSHDRYANVEVSYLLQRMESYRGLAILTTNMRHAIDTAFVRRIRFIVDFPFPDAELRARIWQTVFPAGTPTAELDFGKLARLNVPGGIIRNIAVQAAFLAAEASSPVRMAHLLQAARVEYAKLERPLSAGETGAWI